MKNIFTKVLTGIFLAAFVTTFGMASVFADQNSSSSPAPATGGIIDCPTCQGEEFVDVITNRGSGQGGGGQVTITG